MSVSVAIAAYCGEKFIGEQLESLAAQTQLPDEVVICDDSPDDLTEKAVANFSDKLNIRYFRNDSRLGVNGNFAKAVSQCSGEIIFLCDQDDFWYPEKIRIMTKKLESDPDADGVFCDSRAVDRWWVPLGFSLWQMRNFTEKMQQDVRNGKVLQVFLKRVTLSTHNIAFRRRALNYILPFPDLPLFFSDTWIGLRIALLSNWVMVEEMLTDYRIHGENLSAPELAGISAQMKLSCSARSKNSIAVTVDLADALASDLPPDIPQTKLAMLIAFRKHYETRSRYSANFILRAAGIIREIFSMRYHHYSNGWKSMAADLFLFRSPKNFH